MMNVSLVWEGNNITTEVITYTYSNNICDSKGQLEITVTNTGRSYIPYSTVILYEGGNKRGTFYLDIITDNYDGTLKLSCGNGYKKYKDYFITEVNNIDSLEYSRAWIERFLGEATIDYTFNTDSVGQIINNNTSIGPCTCLDAVTPLLQQNGWYLYFDDSNIATIGTLDYDTSSYDHTLTDTDILDLKLVQDDKMLRNRVVVWGNGNSDLQRWVFADVSKDTPWSYDTNDKRTLVVANSYIKESSTANALANRALNEFSQITFEKHIEVAGTMNVNLGEHVLIKSKYFTGIGLVTTVGSKMSDEGLITTIILDERCPRLFGYFDYGGYVYAGTEGNGVYRKLLNYNHVWSAFNTGIADSFVSDLSISNGVFASICTVSGEDFSKLYYRIVDDESWTEFTPASLIDPETEEEYSSDNYHCTGCAVDKITSRIYGVFNLNENINYINSIPVVSGTKLRSWLVKFNPINSSYLSYPITISGGDSNLYYNAHGFDVDSDGSSPYVTVLADNIPENEDTDEWVHYNYGSSDNGTDTLADFTQYTSLPSDADSVEMLRNTNFVRGLRPIIGTYLASFNPIFRHITSTGIYLDDSDPEEIITGPYTGAEAIYLWANDTSSTQAIRYRQYYDEYYNELSNDITYVEVVPTGKYDMAIYEEDGILYGIFKHNNIWDRYVVNFETGTSTYTTVKEYVPDNWGTPSIGLVRYDSYTNASRYWVIKDGYYYHMIKKEVLANIVDDWYYGYKYDIDAYMILLKINMVTGEYEEKEYFIVRNRFIDYNTEITFYDRTAMQISLSNVGFGLSAGFDGYYSDRGEAHLITWNGHTSEVIIESIRTSDYGIETGEYPPDSIVPGGVSQLMGGTDLLNGLSYVGLFAKNLTSSWKYTPTSTNYVLQYSYTLSFEIENINIDLRLYSRLTNTDTGTTIYDTLDNAPSALSDYAFTRGLNSRKFGAKIMEVDRNPYGTDTHIYIRNPITFFKEKTIDAHYRTGEKYIDVSPYMDDYDNTLYILTHVGSEYSMYPIGVDYNTNTVNRYINLANGTYSTYKYADDDNAFMVLQNFVITMGGNDPIHNFGPRLSCFEMLPYGDSKPSSKYNFQLFRGNIGNTVTDSSFTKVIDLPYKSNIEISNGRPIVVYGGIEDYNKGYIWFSDDEGEVDFYHLNTYYLEDDIVCGGEFVRSARAFSSIADGNYSRFILFCQDDETNPGQISMIDFDGYFSPIIDDKPQMYRYQLTDYHTFDTGNVQQVETTNYQDFPYIFASLEGSPSTFYQKEAMYYDDIETEFFECSTGLPNSNITVIRADDRM